VIESAKDRMIEWWSSAYLESNAEFLRQRFLCEAIAALPIIESADDTEQIFEALQLKRTALKQDLQPRDWDYG
jgi:hypothetical protein